MLCRIFNEDVHGKLVEHRESEISADYIRERADSFLRCVEDEVVCVVIGGKGYWITNEDGLKVEWLYGDWGYVSETFADVEALCKWLEKKGVK